MSESGVESKGRDDDDIDADAVVDDDGDDDDDGDADDKSISSVVLSHCLLVSLSPSVSRVLPLVRDLIRCRSKSDACSSSVGLRVFSCSSLMRANRSKKS